MEDHHFNRRGTDANVAALSVRVSGLEGRVERVEQEVAANRRELAANTALTRQVHQMAERTEQNTTDIVDAVKWLGTSRKVIVATVATFGGLGGSIFAVYQAGKALQLWA